ATNFSQPVDLFDFGVQYSTRLDIGRDWVLSCQGFHFGQALTLGLHGRRSPLNRSAAGPLHAAESTMAGPKPGVSWCATGWPLRQTPADAGFDRCVKGEGARGFSQKPHAYLKFRLRSVTSRR